ncbi:ROK family protein [Leucobacter iarius]|uniref:ROK family protein n=1 Tax=Leucobacter iarius TaxID=333963 RepID=UPI0031E02464
MLSVDVGGTKTLAALVARDGRILAEREQTTRTSAGDEIARALVFGCAISGVVAEAAHSGGGGGGRGGRSEPLAIVAGVPEYVDPAGRVTSDEVLRWDTDPNRVLVDLAAGRGVAAERTRIESDVRLGAHGEGRYGAGRGLASFLYVSLGTGLSSTLVIDGTPWSGARGQAIALGEKLLESGENLESVASGTGVERRYAEATGARLRGPEIVRRSYAGDRVAAVVLESAGVALADALADATELLDPHAIVIGGGLGAADTPLMAAAGLRYRRRTERRAGAAEMLRAECGKRSALLGGAAVAWDLADGTVG